MFKIELEANSKELNWSDKEIQSSYEEKFAEKFIVKEDIYILPDVNER